VPTHISFQDGDKVTTGHIVISCISPVEKERLERIINSELFIEKWSDYAKKHFSNVEVGEIYIDTKTQQIGFELFGLDTSRLDELDKTLIMSQIAELLALRKDQIIGLEFKPHDLRFCEVSFGFEVDDDNQRQVLEDLFLDQRQDLYYALQNLALRLLNTTAVKEIILGRKCEYLEVLITGVPENQIGKLQDILKWKDRLKLKWIDTVRLDEGRTKLIVRHYDPTQSSADLMKMKKEMALL
jgi:hypothetical protein